MTLSLMTSSGTKMKRDIQHNGGVVILNVIYAECCICWVSQTNPLCWMSSCWVSQNHFKVCCKNAKCWNHYFFQNLIVAVGPENPNPRVEIFSAQKPETAGNETGNGSRTETGNGTRTGNSKTKSISMTFVWKFFVESQLFFYPKIYFYFSK
jgi:hypothetical protein